MTRLILFVGIAVGALAQTNPSQQVLLSLNPAAASGQLITLKQSIPAVGTATSGTTVTTTFGSNVTSGDTVIVLSANALTTQTVSSISGGGCTFSLAKGVHAQKDAEVWFAQNCTGGSAAITATIAATITSSTLAAIELAGMPTTGVNDTGETCTTQTSCGNSSGGSTTSTSPLITPTTSKDAFCATVGRNGGSASALTADGTGTVGGTGTAWTSITFTNGNAAYTIIDSTNGTYGNHWTVSNAAWENAIACFKAN